MATSLPELLLTFILLIRLVLIVSSKYHPINFNTIEELKYIKDNNSINLSDYRLPKTIKPVSYILKITAIDFDKFIFYGSCSITAQVKESVKEIVLNAKSITINVNAVLENRKYVSVKRFELNNKTGVLKIILKRNLILQSTIKILLSFKGKLRDDMKGFYKSSYYNEEGQQRWLAATHFEPISARSAFPCFDEPEFKAEFQINVKVPNGYSCLSNMNYKFDNKTNWCHFEKSPKMSTYTVAFVISDFRAYPTNIASLKIWTRANALPQAVFGLEIGAKALQAFSKLFGINYFDNMNKMDMIALPDFSAGAMENWGLITYRESNGLYNEKHSSDMAKQRVASVIVHECAHMWFGNLVTPRWWTYLWLSEAFARYYQYMGTDLIIENWNMHQQFIVEQFQKAMAVDTAEESKPITRHDKDMITPAQLRTAGGKITYNKGASIIRMMEKIFGVDRFNKALRQYIKERKFRSAKPKHLWRAFKRFIDPELDVATIMDTWTKQAGYPYITATVEPDRIKLKQDRFLLHHSNAMPDQLWWVPITLSSSSNASSSTKPVFWLSKQKDEIKRNNRKDSWLILNVQSAGFYRVHYDKDSWNRIIKLLMSGNFDKIHVVNRAAIVDDLLNLARAQLVNYEFIFQGLRYLKKEKHYLPFKSALTGLHYVTRVMAESSDYNIIKNYVISLIRSIYDELTFNDKPNDDQLTILLRQELNNKACSFDDALCIQKSRHYFNEWKNNRKLVPKNQRSVVYCTAIRRGTENDWHFLYEQYRKTNVAAEQVTILTALGCSQDRKILEKYLLNALSGFEISRIRKQDISRVFNSVYTASLNNAEFMIDFANKNHQALYNYYKNYQMVGSLIIRALKRYPIKRLADKVEKIVKANAPHIIPNVKSIGKNLNFVKHEIYLFNNHLTLAINSIKETNPSNTKVQLIH